MSFRRCDTPSSGHKFAKHQGTHYTFADGSCFNNGKPNARAGYVLFVNVCCCRSLSIYFVHLSLSFQKKMLSSCFFFVRFHAFFGPNDARNTIARFSGVQSNNRAHVCALQYIMQVRLGACSTVQKKKKTIHTRCYVCRSYRVVTTPLSSERAVPTRYVCSHSKLSLITLTLTLAVTGSRIREPRPLGTLRLATQKQTTCQRRPVVKNKTIEGQNA